MKHTFNARETAYILACTGPTVARAIRKGAIPALTVAGRDGRGTRHHIGRAAVLDLIRDRSDAAACLARLRDVEGRRRYLDARDRTASPEDLGAKGVAS